MADYLRVADDFSGLAGHAHLRAVADATVPNALAWSDPFYFQDYYGVVATDGAGNLVLQEKTEAYTPLGPPIPIAFPGSDWAQLTLLFNPLLPGFPPFLIQVFDSLGVPYPNPTAFTDVQVAALLEWAGDPDLSSYIATFGPAGDWTEEQASEFLGALDMIDGARTQARDAASWPALPRSRMTVRLSPFAVGLNVSSDLVVDGVVETRSMTVGAVIPAEDTPYVEIFLSDPSAEGGFVIRYPVPEMTIGRAPLELVVSATGEVTLTYDGVVREIDVPDGVSPGDVFLFFDKFAAGTYRRPVLGFFTNEGVSNASNGWGFNGAPAPVAAGGTVLSSFEFILSTDAAEPFWTQFVGTYEVR